MYSLIHHRIHRIVYGIIDYTGSTDFETSGTQLKVKTTDHQQIGSFCK